MRPEYMRPEQLKHLAIVAHFCYASFDLAANCIYHLVKTKSIQEDMLEQYLAEFKKNT
jgi:hypothetical protein